MRHLVLIGLLLISSLGFAKSIDSVYEVPGFNGAAEALFPMTFNIDVNGSNVSVDYDLPELLTGLPNQIQAEGSMISKNMAILKGPKSRLTCDIPSKLCSVIYKNLDTDLNLVKENLLRSGFSQDQISSRLEVASRFIHDPEGVVRYGKKY